MSMDRDDFRELADWDDNTIELSVSGQHRVILNTMHGMVVIDVRVGDVNAFVNLCGRRDFLLIPPKT